MSAKKEANEVDAPVPAAPPPVLRPEDDYDSPDRAILTPNGLRRFLGMSMKWVEVNTQARRLPGQFKSGGAWRYRKAAIELQIMNKGQVLLATRNRG